MLHDRTSRDWTYYVEVYVPWNSTVSGPSMSSKGNSSDKPQAGGVCSGQKIVYVVSLAAESCHTSQSVCRIQ